MPLKKKDKRYTAIGNSITIVIPAYQDKRDDPRNGMVAGFYIQ